MNFRKIGNGLKWGLVCLMGAMGAVYMAVCFVVFIVPLIAVGWVIDRMEQDHVRRALDRGEWP